ncbi:MAG TPA: hypothetical protein VLC46_16405 [Thermoanaerobaculia bacterium]|jgi:hypothetical protein|nr:hypothetical protein [Thermoanaerobaculia bacterium]
MSGAKTSEPGLVEQFTIDGANYQQPVAGGYLADNPLSQSVFKSASGAQVIVAAYRGDGLPDRSDSYAFTLPYDIDDTNGLMARSVEVLRATSGPHFFADWKQRAHFYTLRAAQQFIYLPREDGFGKWGIGTAAVLTLNGTAIGTVVYQSSVASGDAVPANAVWISKALVQHPLSGLWCAPMKIGTPIVAPATLLVEYYPVFRVDVTGVQTKFSTVGREDKTLFMSEVN